MLTAGKELRTKLINLTRRFSIHEKVQWEKVLGDLDKDLRILEVGCGKCSKTKLLQNLGFNTILGVEKNQQLVESAINEGFNVVGVDEFEREYMNEKFDLLILSHIIEHFDFLDLISLMKGYLKHLKPGGMLFIATPVLHDHFWLDLDHVKPYYPHGIKNFFGSSDEQVQCSTGYELKLKDVRFRKSPYKIKLMRSLLLKKNDLPALLVNLLCAFCFKLTCGLLGHKTGWVGLYKVL